VPTLWRFQNGTFREPLPMTVSTKVAHQVIRFF
jgi:hypothetical protein